MVTVLMLAATISLLSALRTVTVVATSLAAIKTDLMMVMGIGHMMDTTADQVTAPASPAAQAALYSQTATNTLSSPMYNLLHESVWIIVPNTVTCWPQ